MVEGRVYRILEVFTNLVYLNFLWLVACLPVFTIPPSTAAMFGIVREWVKGEEPPVAWRFVFIFREDFRRSLLVGVVWALIGAALAADFYVIGVMETFRRPLYVALFALAVIYACASVYLFPVMADYDVGWKNVLKNAVLFPLASPLTAAQCLLVVGVAAFAAVTLPVTLLISGSATAYATYFFCEKSFRRVETLKGSVTENQTNRRKLDE